MAILHLVVFTKHRAYLFVLFIGFREWHIIWGYQELIYFDVILLLLRKVLINSVIYIIVGSYFWKHLFFEYCNGHKSPR